MSVQFVVSPVILGWAVPTRERGRCCHSSSTPLRWRCSGTAQRGRVSGSEQPGRGAQAHGAVQEDDDEFEAYRKRMMLGYKYRPNPLGNPRKQYY